MSPVENALIGEQRRKITCRRGELEKILISTVTPVYAGELFLPDLLESLRQLRAEWERNHDPVILWESIFVCDGPIDASESILRSFAREHAWIKILRLSGHSGQHAATITGISESAGDWVVTLDEDMQHRPEWIRHLLETAVADGSDLVYAKPAETSHSFVRDFAIKLCKSLLSTLSGNPHVKDFNSFRLIRGSIGRAVASHSGPGMYLDVALCSLTERISTVPLPMHDLRYESNGSGYTIGKLWVHLGTLLRSLQAPIIHSIVFLGLSLTAVGALLGVWLLVTGMLHPTYTPAREWILLCLAGSSLGGLSCFVLSMLIQGLSSPVPWLCGQPGIHVIDLSKGRHLSKSLS